MHLAAHARADNCKRDNDIRQWRRVRRAREWRAEQRCG
jgi:hypothetical protein